MPARFDQILGRVANHCFATRSHYIAESFRPNQVESKKWLAYEILKFKKDFKKVAVLGSWNSILLYELLSADANIEFWDFYDIDQNVHIDRDKYFEVNGMRSNYNSFSSDVTTLFYQPGYAQQYDLIINPSCEHMIDIKACEGPMYALTSNNYTTVKDHINTVEHETDLAIKNGINNVLYKGSLKLPNYTRYCVVGYAK